MKIVAVVVTFNRLHLLKKCINSIERQSRKPDELIIINNASTDGTREWLDTQPFISITQENTGGAAGFSRGIKEAYHLGADWVWLMDDDSIPQNDALENLLSALTKLNVYKTNIGFLSSKVLWTDSTAHKMNRTWPLKKERIPQQFQAINNITDLPLIQWGTFVSMLLSAKAIEKVGLPIKEFFIWCDDVEYSTRIIRNGMAGIAVADSVVIHETPVNHESNIFKDSISNLWKFRYGLRNELYNKRMHYGQSEFWSVFIKRIVIWPIHILHKQRSNRWKFINVIWKSSLDALTFKPKIERVSKLEVIDHRKVIGVEPKTIKL